MKTNQESRDVLQVWRPTDKPDVFEDLRLTTHTQHNEDLSASAYDANRPARRSTDPGPRRKG